MHQVVPHERHLELAKVGAHVEDVGVLSEALAPQRQAGFQHPYGIQGYCAILP